MAVAPLLSRHLIPQSPKPTAVSPGAMSGPLQTERLSLNGIPIDKISLSEAAARIIHALENRTSLKPLLIMGPNAQLITLAARHPRFRNALRSADLNPPDGISIVLASRVLGQPIAERVTGGDLMEQLCIEAAQHNLSVFFLGGLPEAAENAARKFHAKYPGFRLAGTYCPPRGFESDPAECARIRDQISAAKPDLLCVAFGAPKQEIWMHENCLTLPIGAAISVGAALDTQAGLRKRAPKWTHRIGCEWLYRLVREPRRLWRRYLIGNTHFLWIVARQYCRMHFTGDQNASATAASPAQH